MKKNVILLIAVLVAVCALILYVRELTLYGQLESKVQTEYISKSVYDNLLEQKKKAESELSDAMGALDSTRRRIFLRNLLTQQKRRENEKIIANLDSLNTDQLDSIIAKLSPDPSH